MKRRIGTLNSLSSSRGGEGWGEEANSLTIVGRLKASRSLICARHTQTQPKCKPRPFL
jgi:hypothetical protein